MGKEAPLTKYMYHPQHGRIMSDLERIVKAAEMVLHIATNEQHETEVHGRAVRYELKGYFYKWELNFKEAPLTKYMYHASTPLFLQVGIEFQGRSC